MTAGAETRESHFLYKYWPAVSSFLFVVFTLAMWWILTRDVPSCAFDDQRCPGAKTSLGGREWQIWLATVSAGLAIALLLAIHGGVRLRRLPTQLPRTAGISKRTMWLHALAAVLWVAALAVTVTLAVHENHAWPMTMGWRLRLVSTVGLVCATPWVAITWLCHQATRPYWRTPHQLASAVPGQASSHPTPDVDQEIAALQQIWSQIVGVALAFAGLVVISMVPTGALRNLWLSQNVTGDAATSASLANDFPSSVVLLFGAMWALLASLVVIPLVFSWRAAAQSLVDTAYPPNVTTAKDKDAVAARGSLEAMLNLTSGIVRNPLTVLTVLTPLATAALAAFVPAIGK